MKLDRTNNNNKNELGYVEHPQSRDERYYYLRSLALDGDETAAADIYKTYGRTHCTT